MKKSIFLSSIMFLFFSCQKEALINFSEQTFYSETNAIISIIVPKAIGNNTVAKTINSSLEKFTCGALTIDAAKEKQTSIKNCAEQFNLSYASFKELISEVLYQDLPIWEAHIDGEITFKNENLISVAMNSSINTGGAKSILKIKFFNFNPSTGKTLEKETIISDIGQFEKVVENYFKKELLTSHHNGDYLVENVGFKWPETIGFSDDGVIFFYNSFELMSFNDVLEFTIPYEVANDYLMF